jgi:3-methyladenine DNA glycosylase AlkD
MLKNTNYISEIELKLFKKLRSKKFSHNSSLASYYNTQLAVAGLKVPIQRQIAKEFFSFSKKEFIQQLHIWEEVFHSAKLFETKSQALFFVAEHFKFADKKILWQSLNRWVKSIDNWAHSDLLSSFYAKILEEEELLVLPTLKKWNSSKFLWERRQSIVSLIYYRRTKKFFVSFGVMKSYIENLLDDKEYYVQKGVGWTLREMRQVYKIETDIFLLKNIGRISSIAFSTSIEHMSKIEKEKLKLIRKELRAKQVV